MRVQIKAIIESDDDADLILVAKARATANGGSSELLSGVGDALVECFDLTDDEGQPLTAGLTIQSIEALELCASCDRKVHR